MGSGQRWAAHLRPLRASHRPGRSFMPADQRPPPARALNLLASGRIEIQGRMPWSSNGTFLVTVSDGDDTTPAIYKPGRGERPLWDFPDGLYRREVAAYELAV